MFRLAARPLVRRLCVLPTRQPLFALVDLTTAPCQTTRTQHVRFLATTSSQTAAVSEEPATVVTKKRPWLMWVGGIIVSLCAIDTFLLWDDERDKNARMAQLSREEAEFRAQLVDEWKDKPTLLHTKAIFKYQMGGLMGLRDIQIGDTMEVLEQETGPNKLYALCRTRTEDGDIASIGWYPMEFMEEIVTQATKETKAPRKKFLGLF